MREFAQSGAAKGAINARPLLTVFLPGKEPAVREHKHFLSTVSTAVSSTVCGKQVPVVSCTTCGRVW
jgi:hypothetical protein